MYIFATYESNIPELLLELMAFWISSWFVELLFNNCSDELPCDITDRTAVKNCGRRSSQNEWTSWWSSCMKSNSPFWLFSVSVSTFEW